MPRLVELLLIAGLAACGSESGDDDPVDAGSLDPGPLDGPCADSERVGAFEATLDDGFTGVQGKVVDAVAPSQIPVVADTAGDCRLLRPAMLFCDPACGAGTTCAPDNTCVPSPAAISVGTVTVDGMKSPIEMTASPPVYFYTNLDPLEHPGFDEGDELVLIASGEGNVGPFALGARGVAALVTSSTSVSLETDVPTVVEWTPPGQAELSTVHLNLNIAQHGGTPGRIECEVPDTASFELPVSLTNQLLDAGYSGFPSLVVTRRSADSTTTEVGCVQFAAQSAVTLEVEIPGLISCSDDGDCPPGQTCQPDLTCG